MMRGPRGVCWALLSTVPVQPSTWCPALPFRFVSAVAVTVQHVLNQQIVEHSSVESYPNFA